MKFLNRIVKVISIGLGKCISLEIETYRTDSIIINISGIACNVLSLENTFHKWWYADLESRSRDLLEIDFNSLKWNYKQWTRLVMSNVSFLLFWLKYTYAMKTNWRVFLLWAQILGFLCMLLWLSKWNMIVPFLACHYLWWMSS